MWIEEREDLNRPGFRHAAFLQSKLTSAEIWPKVSPTMTWEICQQVAGSYKRCYTECAASLIKEVGQLKEDVENRAKEVIEDVIPR